ncbi:MAG TPA: GH1 family beta-glucosidase [Chloroflexota bacterium]
MNEPPETVGARFPRDFVWGAATAAYQIEGAVNEDGRGESIWDRFCHTPGRIEHGDTGDVACDHYHRWSDDIKLMADLGLGAYRFSIAWPRIFPNGSGPINEAGLAWYERLVDTLLEANIQPWVTLYHWDLPQALQDRGGWAARDTVDAFVEYARTVVERLGDRVAGWITHNEPWVVAFAGHYQGLHAPGVTDLRTTLQVAHHVLLSHGRAVAEIRRVSPRAQVGITLNLSPVIPASDSADDVAAAWRSDGTKNRWFLDPLYGRGYPADILDVYGADVPRVAASDLADIAAPIDFLGINFYYPTYARADSRHAWRASSLRAAELHQRGLETTDMGWPIVPAALRDLVERVQRDYRPAAMYITENGAAFTDTLADGSVHDDRRIRYLAEHLSSLAQAINAGAAVRGYFVWSLLDNFEWAHGYQKRFGITYVDYASQRRILKDSGGWYGALARGHAQTRPA